MTTRGETNYLGLIPQYHRSMTLVTISLIASGDADERSLCSIFVLLLLLFRFRFSEIVALLLCMCSVESSSLLFSKVFPVDEFTLFRGDSWEDMTEHTLECDQRSSLLTCEHELLVATFGLFIHRNKILLIGMKS